MFDEHYALRGSLADEVAVDLVGPRSPDEVIDDDPLTQYVAGILYPRSLDPIDSNQDDGLDAASGGDELGGPDPPVAMANLRYPSSMGMTFAVDPTRAVSLNITVQVARYEPTEPIEVAESPAHPRDRRGAVDSPATRWQRLPSHPDPMPLRIDSADAGSYRDVIPGLSLFTRVREPDDRGHRAVTVALVNELEVERGRPRDADSFYQPQITVDAVGAAVFVERTSALSSDDEELAGYELLYRHARTFGVGHGCAVRWESDPNDSDGSAATAIRTTFVPEYELLVTESNPDIDAESLSMTWLVDNDRATVTQDLERFCTEYEHWIERQREMARSLGEPMQRTGEAHLAACAQAAKRMRGGVEILRTDEDAWRAFMFANRAMMEQRARSDWIQGDKQAPGPVVSPQHGWRPFQLAFILLCLRGIVVPDDQERRLTDLLWFPTGGGKTEAYLGLIAFTAFLRRLRAQDHGAGVTALMRYTLRLLTIQQFERAALLICACESIRRRDSDLGARPFSIGLWVGEGATPNDHTQTRKSLDALHNNRQLSEANPMQLQACPWCGTRFDHRNYWLQQSRPRRLVISCRTADCEFRDGLPAYVVDEDIYRERPTLLIATADKFAGLPWRTDIGKLFNRPDADPPDLIIQDELHLISGPLGTLTGLYETAIDYLATRDGVPAKIVASTATIRRAGRQGGRLFAREVRQFPAPGLDARDSYFAVEAPRDRRGNRMYVGLLAPATSQTTLLIRTYSAILQRVSELPARDEIRDAYWTLVGYFNSLRVLGGARMAVQDDVGDRIDLLARRAGSEPRNIEERIELTSRVDSADVPGYLKRMADSHPDPAALNLILATNMISVGIDINRLGLMVVMGQPQSTSEYIQATSRVGRRDPGVVFTIYNGARSRDRSHYESFVSYHSALYRQVEATSVTPYSPRARDRGLHAVIIGLARLLIPDFADNASASQIGPLEDKLDIVREVIAERVRLVAPDELDATMVEFDEVIREWKQRAEECPTLKFSSPFATDEALLITAGEEDGAPDGALSTLRSLRDVDTSSNLYLVR